MRTTLHLEDDALRAIKVFARTHRISLGKAASELIRRGTRYQLATRRVNGLPVLEAPEYFQTITSEQVRDRLSEQ